MVDGGVAVLRMAQKKRKLHERWRGQLSLESFVLCTGRFGVWSFETGASHRKGFSFWQKSTPAITAVLLSKREKETQLQVRHTIESVKRFRKI